MKKFALAFLSLSIGFAAAAFIGEGLLRAFFKTQLRVTSDERTILYRYDAELGWFPSENIRSTYSDTRTISVIQNSLGFRGDEFGPKDRPRLVCLGDSFVWGYDVEADERFTTLLQRRIPEWQVLNLGVSGYGTDQQYLLLRRIVPRLQPDAVLLVFDGLNDVADNSSNVRYDGYFKPYFVMSHGELELKGTPVPDSYNYFHARTRERWWWHSYFLRGLIKSTFRAFLQPRPVAVADPSGPLLETMHRYCEREGLRLMVGMVTRDSRTGALCAAAMSPCVDLTGAERYTTGGGHWTPAGHSFVADKFYEAMREQGWIGQ